MGSVREKMPCITEAATKSLNNPSIKLKAPMTAISIAPNVASNKIFRRPNTSDKALKQGVTNTFTRCGKERQMPYHRLRVAYDVSSENKRLCVSKKTNVMIGKIMLRHV